MCSPNTIWREQHLELTLLFKKGTVSEPICMHYSNTSLKIASLFLPRSYLCFPASSLSRFKSDRGSLDRRNTGSIYTLVGRQQSKRLKPVSAVTTHRDILHLSRQWEINFMMRIPCAKENIGLIVERLALHFFQCPILSHVFSLSFIPPLTCYCLCFTGLSVFGVAPMKCDKQEFTVWINWTALQWTRLLIKQTAQSSLPSSTFFIPFSHVNKRILRSVNVYPRQMRASAAGTWLKLEAAGCKLKISVRVTDSLCHVVQL